MANIREFIENDRLVIEVVADSTSDAGALPPLDRVIEVVVQGPRGLSGVGGTAISPLDYGAVADGITDDATALQAAIDALPATGGDVALPAGVMAIGATIVVNKSNVRLIGLGGDNRHNTAPFVLNAGTRLKWTGAAGGTMIRFTSTSGAANPKMTGGGLKGMVIDAAATAGCCLEVLSWNAAHFEDLLLYDATIACLDMNVVADLADPRDPQENVFDRVFIAALSGSADGIRMGAATPGANPSYNSFYNSIIHVNGGIGVNLFDADNNWFSDFRIFVTGAGAAVVFNGSNVNASYVPRDNVFHHLTTQATIIARGTPSFTYPAGRNACFNMDQTNATVAPTVEAGTRLSYSYLDGTQYRMPLIRSVLAADESAANAGYDRLNTDTAVSAVIVNDANGHLLLMNSSGTVRWIQSIDQVGGNLNFSIASGGAAAAVNFSRPVRPVVATVAGLAAYTGAAGQHAFASNGRKPGEGAGFGTGVPVCHDGTAWRDPTGATVQA